MTRCPKAWLRDEGGEAESFVREWSWLKRHGVLPVAGGLLDQDPRFVTACETIDAEMERLSKVMTPDVD